MNALPSEALSQTGLQPVQIVGLGLLAAIVLIVLVRRIWP